MGSKFHWRGELAAAGRRAVAGAVGLVVALGGTLHVSAVPGAAAEGAPPAVEAPAATSLGVNLTGINDWTPETPFVDVFRTARQWVSQETSCPGLTTAYNCRPGYGWGRGPAIALDEHGWVTRLEPNQYVDSPIFTSGQWPAGRYVVTWEGTGDVSLRENGTMTNVTANRFEYDLVPGRTGFLAITRTDPSNPVRNIHVWMPGYEGDPTGQVFHPAFLASLSGMRTLRFMDWMHTNGGSPFVRWTDYPTMQEATQTRAVAPQLMAELANRLDADAWVNIPHQADDDFVRNFARVFRDHLEPGRRVYIEYSNEMWNTAYGYPQTFYAQREGVRLGLSETDWVAGFRYQARRSVEIFKLWNEVFGTDADSRLVRVLGLQSANNYTAQHVLDWSDEATEGRRAADWADATAIAPYIHCNDTWLSGSAQRQFPGTDDPAVRAAVLRETPDRLLDACQRSVEIDMRNEITAHKEIANRYGLALVAYEGGQHLVNMASHAPNNPAIASVRALTDRFHAVNRSPRMRDIYARYLHLWRELGGGTMMLFLATGGMSQHGAWGLREYQAQPLSEAPKARAALEFQQALGQAPLQVARPTVTRLSVLSGLAAGGTTLTLTGANLASTSRVSFGSVSALFRTSVVRGVTNLTVTTPRYIEGGTVDVTVTNPAGTSTATTATRFTYHPPPAITSLSTQSALTIGGTLVTVTGTNLTGASRVSVGTAAGTSVRVLSPTSMQFVAPARPTTGGVDVTITSPYGTSAVVSAGRLNYVHPPRPVIAGLSTDVGPSHAPTTVLINGANFRGTTRVTVGERTATFSVLSDNQIRAVLPAQANGVWVNVFVFTPGGHSEAHTGTDFRYLAAVVPTVTGLSETRGQTHATHSVLVDGQGFRWASRVLVGGTPAPFTAVSETQLRVTLPARTVTGPVNVQVVTPAGTSSVTANGVYTYVTPPLPTVTSLSVSRGLTTARTTVLINGTALTAATRVTVGGVSVAFTRVSESQIRVVLPTHTAGSAAIQVTTPGGLSTGGGNATFTWVTSL
ncbi:IPT/TIG domain-containing protein [Couchioplanes azureus]|uniref:IPT/TIG domain-containing protein n=1 Tax=Couchioplanes caeruleus TaxID=56438 RepID=UPI001670839E|nr:IPT/TIG domain-containing protein [Couchioplanes caeruleus]GGQ84284.1 hypothetical protein GCM10010166_63180 [Couchioplanes caeruleus subsp. azureus]